MIISLAGHKFSVNGGLKNSFNEYDPFRIDQQESGDNLFSLSVVEQPLQKPLVKNLVGDFSDENGRCMVYSSAEGYQLESFELQKSEPYVILECSEDFRQASLYLYEERNERLAVSNALMMLYAFASSGFDTLLLHSSVVVHKGLAYMFLGKSGTGKSTHSRMWLENIEGTHLLNDDNPVVRIVDGKAWIYGTPWSGKTPCYRCEAYPIGGIVRIWQRPENAIKRLRSVEALAALMPTVSKLPSAYSVQDGVLNALEKLIEITPVYSLGCLPNSAAAMVCSNEVVR